MVHSVTRPLQKAKVMKPAKMAAVPILLQKSTAPVVAAAAEPPPVKYEHYSHPWGVEWPGKAVDYGAEAPKCDVGALKASFQMWNEYEIPGGDILAETMMIASAALLSKLPGG